jgi:hypothetical membrane protein
MERILIFSGVLAPLLRLSLMLLLGFLHPGYSQGRDFISVLGARGAPYADLMNYVGIVSVGLLLGLFSIALFRAHRQSVLGALSALLLCVSALAFVAVGIFPCDPGCSLANPSPTMKVHVVAGMVAMTGQSLAVLCFGLRVTRGGCRGQAAVSLGLGLLGLACLVLLSLVLAGSLRTTQPALPQKVLQVTGDLWVLLMASTMLIRTAPQSTDSDSRLS